jgi:chemotaxis protein CheD
MSFRVKHATSMLPTLPLEYRPHLAEASDQSHGRHYLLPGKVFASAEPFAITAIVGSSVALCIWDPTRRVGGAAQFLLPETPQGDYDDTKYGDAAGNRLLRLLLDLGANPRALQAKVFGGLQPVVTFGNPAECLGTRNAAVAMRFLASKEIHLVAREIGGRSGRKVVFHTDDGRTWSETL